MTSERQQSSMRERFREQMRDDMKEVALAQLAAGGAEAISLNSIAKELRVSGSALYRYYTSRDELLNALVLDAYGGLHDALEREVAGSANMSESIQRIRGLARAYRRWASEQPHCYELLFKPPVPGYDAHAEPLSEAGRSLMGIVLGVLADRPSSSERPTSLSSEEVLSARRIGAEQFQRAIRVWSRLHGLVSLEIGGAFRAMQVDVDALFEHEVGEIAA